MDDFAQFLEDRYDEAEALANAAAADGTPEWNLGDDPDPMIGASRIYDAKGEVVVYDEGAPSPNEAAHIAANDPAHRLADLKLKRAILAEHAPVRSEGRLMCATCLGRRTFYPCPTACQLGTEFAEHPAYQESWKP